MRMKVTKSSVAQEIERWNLKIYLNLKTCDSLVE